MLLSSRWSGDGRAAERVQVGEEVEELVQLALDLARRLAVALRVPRQALEAARLAPRDRDRSEVPEPPVLRAVDRGWDDRHILLQRDHRRTRLHLSQDAAALPRPLDVEPERLPLRDGPSHHPHGLAVGLAASDGERPEGADQLSQA